MAEVMPSHGDYIAMEVARRETERANALAVRVDRLERQVRELQMTLRGIFGDDVIYSPRRENDVQQ